MIFGAMILGGAAGIVAAIAVFASGAGLIPALLTYPVAACGATLGVLVLRAALCRGSRAFSNTPRSVRP